MSTPLPASSTKHLDVVHHSLPKDHLTVLQLRQISATSGAGRNGNGANESGPTSSTTSTGTTGTTLWLGGQVLACYLSSLPPLPAPATTTECWPGRRRAVELGAGVGYLSLVLASLGYDVLSTDIPPVLDYVLSPNIADGLDVLTRRSATPVISGKTATTARESGSGSGSGAGAPSGSRARTLPPQNTIGDITVRELDWLRPAADADVDVDVDFETVRPDLIITSDTIYHPTLVPALFGTIARLSKGSVDAGKKPPVVYLCLERRDSRMVDSAMAQAGGFGIQLRRIGHGRVAKSVERAGWGWKEDDWEGVEVYKGKWTGDTAIEQDASDPV